MIRIYIEREHIYRGTLRRGIHEWCVMVVRDHGEARSAWLSPERRPSRLSHPTWGTDLRACVRRAIAQARATLRAERYCPTLTPELWAVERW